MSEQRLDLEDSSSKLKKVINEMTETMKKQFAEQFKISIFRIIWWRKGRANSF